LLGIAQNAIFRLINGILGETVETIELIHFKSEMEKNAGIIRKILLGNLSKAERVGKPIFYNQRKALSSSLKSTPSTAAVIGGLGLSGAAYGGYKYRN